MALGRPVSELNYLTKGNSCRRFHASLTFYYEERGELTPGEMRLLAFYRRHDPRTAERSYEQRSRRALDSRAQRNMLRLMDSEIDR